MKPWFNTVVVLFKKYNDAENISRKSHFNTCKKIKSKLTRRHLKC